MFLRIVEVWERYVPYSRPALLVEAGKWQESVEIMKLSVDEQFFFQKYLTERENKSGFCTLRPNIFGF